MKDLVCRDARVMPWSNGRAVAGRASRPSASLPSLRRMAPFSSRSWRAETIWPSLSSVLSPASVTTTMPNIRSFSSMKSAFSTNCFSRKRVSPGSSTTTFFIIWRTMTSKCLSLIFTPWRRYTSWISLTRYSWTAVGPWMARMSAGVGAPSDIGMPAFTKSFS